MQFYITIGIDAVVDLLVFFLIPEDLYYLNFYLCLRF